MDAVTGDPEVDRDHPAAPAGAAPGAPGSGPSGAGPGFEDFFAATWPRLYRTALGIAGDPAAAEDALQSAFAKAYAVWPRVRRADSPEAYLRRMVVNEVIGPRRHGLRRRERPHERVPEPAAATSPEGGVVDRDAVWAAVGALPPRQRAVVVLRYYEDLSEEEIAAALGCSRGTVKSQASAALSKLRRHAGLQPGEDA